MESLKENTAILFVTKKKRFSIASHITYTSQNGKADTLFYAVSNWLILYNDFKIEAIKTERTFFISLMSKYERTIILS